METQIIIQIVSAILSNPTVQKGIGEVILELKSKNDAIVNAFITAVESGLGAIQKANTPPPTPPQS